MAFEDTLISLQIKIDTSFSSAQEAQIISALEQLYNIPAGKLLMDSIPAHVGAGQLFDIQKGINSQAPHGGNYVDIAFSDVEHMAFVDNFGEVFDASLLRILTHEMIHAVDALKDPIPSTDYFTASYDYDGPTIEKTNQILTGVEPDRLSYRGADYNITVGHEYTEGNEIDMAFFHSQWWLDQFPTFSTNIFDTSVHVNATRDLIVSGSTHDTFLSGAGNDYLYGKGGNDIFDGGSGDDYIDGGSGDDTADYSGTLGGTDIVPSSGITVEIQAVQTIVNDNYGGTDTLIEVENIIGTDLNDNFLLVGDISDFVNIRTLDAGTSPSGIGNGDTIDFSGVTGQYTTLFVELGDSGGFTVTGSALFYGFDIFGFENAIGSIGKDILTGDDQANRIDGGAGADIIDGGAGIDTLHFAKDGGAVTVDLQAGTGSGGDAEGDTYSNIEVVIGADQNDTFKTLEGSGTMFAGGNGTDTFEVLPGGYSNNINVCVAVQPEVISIVKKVLTITTMSLQLQFSARLNAR